MSAKLASRKDSSHLDVGKLGVAQIAFGSGSTSLVDIVEFRQRRFEADQEIVEMVIVFARHRNTLFECMEKREPAMRERRDGIREGIH